MPRLPLRTRKQKNAQNHRRAHQDCGRQPWGESLHCAHTARYFSTIFPSKSPQARPLETTLELGDPNWTGGDLEGDLPGSCSSGERPGAFGVNLTVCWAVEMEGSEVANLNLGWQKRCTPSCVADSPLSTHLGSIPSGGVRLQPSQPPWQEVAGHWSGYRTPYPQY